MEDSHQEFKVLGNQCPKASTNNIYLHLFGKQKDKGVETGSERGHDSSCSFVPLDSLSIKQRRSLHNLTQTSPKRSLARRSSNNNDLEEYTTLTVKRDRSRKKSVLSSLSKKLSVSRKRTSSKHSFAAKE